MSASPTLAPDLAVGDLGSLRALLSGRRTRGRLDARLNTDTQDTLLTWAARHGQAEAVRLLLEAGASVGATTGTGRAALFIACLEGHVECVRTDPTGTTLGGAPLFAQLSRQDLPPALRVG